MNQQRVRPSDAEIAAMVARVRPEVLHNASSGRWRSRWSRPAIVASFVSAVAVGGVAYAAVERATDEPPETHTGDSVLVIGEPGAKDKWLNISLTYRCRAGESYVLRDDTAKVMSGDCGRETELDRIDPTEGGVRSRGVRKSVPVDEVHGTELRFESDLSSRYRLTATWGPRALMEPADTLPADGADGKPAWDIPDYEVNEYGLTVGAPRINTPESAYPDLFPVRFEGREAYILKKDMLGEDAGNPAEAVRQMKEQRRLGLIDARGNIYRFVYAADGKTRLGKMLVGTVREGE